MRTRITKPHCQTLLVFLCLAVCFTASHGPTDICQWARFGPQAAIWEPQKEEKTTEGGIKIMISCPDFKLRPPHLGTLLLNHRIRTCKPQRHLLAVILWVYVMRSREISQNLNMWHFDWSAHLCVRLAKFTLCWELHVSPLNQQHENWHNNAYFRMSK